MADPFGIMEKQQTDRSLSVCCQCSKKLLPDEIALTRKLINRGASRFFCLSCLARHFELPESALEEKIRQFRAMGCTLFPPEDS